MSFDLTSRNAAESSEMLINIAIRDIRFGPLTREQRAATIFDHGPRGECEFHAAIMGDDDSQFLYIIQGDGRYRLFGACTSSYYTMSGGIFACWVHQECTYSRVRVEGFPHVTSGRLLWCHILKSCHVFSGGRPFFVANQSTQDAIPYHISMGMNTYEESGAESTLKQELMMGILMHVLGEQNFLAEYLNLGITSTQLYDNPVTSYLFYFSFQGADYSNIGSIINSLPTSKDENTMNSGAGVRLKRRKTNKKKKKRRKRKPKTKKQNNY